MNNVSDLKMTDSRPTQTISLSAIKKDAEEDTNKISINATNGGVTGVTEQQTSDRPTIKINPNRKRPVRSTAEVNESIKEVNPNDYMERTEVRPVTIEESAITKLDAAVARKKQEYKDFVESALAADEMNRDRVESGLETVDGEISYLPTGVEELERKEEAKKIEIEKSKTEEDIDAEIEADIENDLDDSELPDATIYQSNETTTASVHDPFKVSIPSEEAEEEKEMEETVKDEPVQEPVVEEVVKRKAAPVVETNETNDPDVDIDQKIRDRITHGSINISSDSTTDMNAISKSTSGDFDINEEDFEDVSITAADDEVQLTDEEIKRIALESDKHLKNEILQKIINAGKKIDTSSFVVSNKVVSIKDALRSSENKVERTATWPLMFAGRVFKASALKGPDIALLSDNDSSRNGLTTQQLRILYEHDANEYKPETLEAWSKTIPYADIDSIFAALYCASMSGSNYMPMVCPKDACQYSYLSENLPIEDLVKFKNDEVKERFESIKATELTPDLTRKYDSVVSVINDKFAVGLKIPSIFTVLYEFGSLNEAFINKYETATSVMQYIDYIYLIDPETRQFSPIGWKLYPGDYAKTFKSKIATYAKILKEFDDTDFSVLIALINSLITGMTDKNEISYEIPAAKCPKCGAPIEAKPIMARGLVFMRQQLVVLATTPTEK